MPEHNPWRAQAAPAADIPTYDPEADCRVRFTQEESERVLMIAEWHAAMRRAHGLEPEPDAIRAMLATAAEAYLGWCAASQAMIEAASEDDADEHDVRH